MQSFSHGSAIYRAIMLKERGFTADQIEETVRNPSWTKKDDARVQKEMGQSRERGSA